MMLTLVASLLAMLVAAQSVPSTAAPAASQSQPATAPPPPTTPAAPTTPTPPTTPKTTPAPAPGAPGAPAPAATGELHAQFVTSRGNFVIQLRPVEAPMACANFVNLAKRGYYNNQPFNGWTRVIRQATGPSDGRSVGYGIRREFSAQLFFDAPGRVALQRMAEGDLAHPTVFFITTKAQDRWNLDMPVFAVVVSGQQVVDAIEKNDTITRIEIQGDPTALLKQFEAEIPKWNAGIDAALAAPAAPAPAPPAAPVRPVPPTPPAR